MRSRVRHSAKDDRVLHGFTIAQLMSLVVVAAGVYLVSRLRAPAPAIVPATLSKSR
jgi:hypothetical protein